MEAKREQGQPARCDGLSGPMPQYNFRYEGGNPTCQAIVAILIDLIRGIPAEEARELAANVDGRNEEGQHGKESGTVRQGVI